MQVQLIVEDKKRSGQVIPINIPSFTIGREKGCDLRSGSSRTSPQHCLIRINEEIITIRDLRSETGTFVNGTKIFSTTILQDGDKIGVGKHTFTLSTQEMKETVESLEPEDNEEDTGILFDIRLEGQRISVTKKRLFQLAKHGMLLPDDVVTIDGTKVFADTIQDIVFGDEQPAKSSLQTKLAQEPVVYTNQKTPIARDISPTDSVWNHFVDMAAVSSNESSDSILPLDTELPDPDEDETDPFNIENEPIVQVVLPLKTSKSVFSEIGDAIAPSLNQVVSTERKTLLHQYYKQYYMPASYVLGVLCLLGILGFLVSGSSSPPGIFYVEGTVLLDGAPAEGVSVTLNPRSETGEAAGGMTDSKGRFTVTTGNAPVGSGAKEGDYDITFRKTELDTLGLTLMEFKRKYGNRRPDTKYVIAQKYGDRNKSGLAPIHIVTDGSNKFKFELTSPPTRKTIEIASQSKTKPKKTPETQESPEIPLPAPPEVITPAGRDIFEAARIGTVQDVAYFLDKEVDVNAQNPFGQTPLHVAIQHNPNEDVALYLLSKEADVNIKDRFGNTPLLLAVKPFRCSMNIVNTLILQGADVDEKDPIDRSLLHIIVSTAPPSSPVNTTDSMVEVLKVLLSKGAFVNPQDRTGRTPLDVANTEEKKVLLRAAGGVERSIPPPASPKPVLDNLLGSSVSSSEGENSFTSSLDVLPPKIEDVPSISGTQPPDIQYNVGITFYRGTKDIPQNRAEALKWFYAAAKQGHADAQFRVGRYFYFGWEVTANESEGIDWIRKAANQGHKEAIVFLQYVARQKELFGTSPSNDLRE